jgi:hypothetical protein
MTRFHFHTVRASVALSRNSLHDLEGGRKTAERNGQREEIRTRSRMSSKDDGSRVKDEREDKDERGKATECWECWKDQEREDDEGRTSQSVHWEPNRKSESWV